jgi:hypothetical protein
MILLGAVVHIKAFLASARGFLHISPNLMRAWAWPNMQKATPSVDGAALLLK